MNTNHSLDQASEDFPARGIAPRPCGAAGLLAGRASGRPWLRQPPDPLPTTPAKVKAKSVIQIFLWGGMSHNDTWDPKPDSGYDYMGEFAQGDPHQRGRDPDRRAVSRCWRSRPTSSPSSAA